MRKALIISYFEWYKERIEPIRQLLVDKGYEPIIITADYSHINKEYKVDLYEECTYVHVMSYKKNLSLNRIVSHLSFAKEIKKYINTIKPQLLYILVPLNSVARYGSLYKKRYPDSILIIDIIDLWPESVPLGKVANSFPANVWKSWRNNAISAADFVFTECDYYKKKLKGIIDLSKTETLYLYKDQAEEERRLVEEIIDQRPSDGVIRFAYLGSMNHIIDIEGISEIIKYYLDSGKKCEFVAIGDGECKALFERTLRNIGCVTCFYGRIFDEINKIKILAPCDYAFNMMKKNISVGLTIKSIDYLSYGIPLINNIKADTWALVENEGVGVNISQHYRDLEYDIDHRKVLDVFHRYFSIKSFKKTINEAIK